MEHINHVPSNKCGNVIDLVFTNAVDMYSDVSHVDSSFPTDHTVLWFHINVSPPPRKGGQRNVYNFRYANIDALKQGLTDLPLEEIVNDNECIDSAWSLWLTNVNAIVDMHVSKICIKQCKAPPWFDNEVRHLMNKKRAAWRKAIRNNKWSKYLFFLFHRHFLLLFY